MAIVEFVFVISVGVLLVLGALNSARSSQHQKQLEEAFYRLLQAQNGQISLIQLAAGARVDAEVAKQYLERQAKAFAATLEVDADGDTFYRFPKLQLPPQR